MGISWSMSKRECQQYLKKIVLIFIGVLLISIFNFRVMYNIDFNKGVNYLVQRIAQDNESWWFFYDKPQINNLSEEIKSFKYKGTKDLYEIGYENARKFGSHFLAERMKNYSTIKGEYERKRRLATGSFAQIIMNTRFLYLLILLYVMLFYFILKKIILLFNNKKKSIHFILFKFLYFSILIRFFLMVKTGLFQIHNDLFNMKFIFYVIICMLSASLAIFIIGLQKKDKKMLFDFLKYDVFSKKTDL